MSDEKVKVLLVDGLEDGEMRKIDPELERLCAFANGARCF
jgi:hypothetical protein